MYMDIPTLPTLNKCLFCVPLRKGLILFGYVKLVYSLSMVAYIAFEMYDGHPSAGILSSHEVLNAERYAFLVLFSVDAVMLLVLIYGAHKKRVSFLNIYLIYGVVSSIVLLLLDMFLVVKFRGLQIILLLFGTVLQIYVILLVRSEIYKLNEENVEYVQTCSFGERGSSNEDPETADIALERILSGR